MEERQHIHQSQQFQKVFIVPQPQINPSMQPTIAYAQPQQLPGSSIPSFPQSHGSKRLRAYRKRRKIVWSLLIVITLILTWSAYNAYVIVRDLKGVVQELKDIVIKQQATSSSFISRQENDRPTFDQEEKPFEEVKGMPYKSKRSQGQRLRREWTKKHQLERAQIDQVLPTPNTNSQPTIRDSAGSQIYSLGANLESSTSNIVSMIQLLDGRLATGNSESGVTAIKMWNTTTGQKSFEFLAGTNESTFEALLQLADGRLLSSTTDTPYSFKVWDINGTLLQTIPTGDAYLINFIQLTSGLVVGVNWRQIFYVWNPTYFNEPIHSFKSVGTTWPGFNPMVQLSGHSSNYLAAVVGNKNVLQVWNTDNWRLTSTIPLLLVPKFINSVSGIDGLGGDKLVIAMDMDYLIVINAFDGAVEQVIQDPNDTDQLKRVRVLDNQYLVTGGSDNAQLKIWNYNSGQLLQNITMATTGAINLLTKLSNAGFASAAYTGLVSIYDQSQ